MFDGFVRTVFVKSVFTCRGFYLSLDEYDRALNVFRASSAGGYGEREQ